MMLVNGIAFLTTLSQKLRLGTTKQLPSCRATQLSNSLTKIVRLYARTGFIVRVIMMDQEFDKVKDACEIVDINTTAVRKHVNEIKCFICTIEERSRALVSDLPYTPLPCQVVIHLVYFAVGLIASQQPPGYPTSTPPRRLSLAAKSTLRNTARPPLAPTLNPAMI
jgi:hypothetical protein